MLTKYWGLYEEPSTYKRDYIPHDLSLNQRKISITSHQEDILEEPKKIIPSLNTITAHDTFQRLDYNTKLPFNALWEPKDTVSIDVKAVTRRHCLGDESLEDAIKTRPRVYMSPSVSLDDIKDPETRKLIIGFTYTTTRGRANKEVWQDFPSKDLCSPVDALTKKHEKVSYNTVDQCPAILPGFQKLARKWDKSQVRGFITKSSLPCEEPIVKSRESETALDEENEIRSLAEQNKLNVIYDKFPSSYGGFRPRVALGVPMKKRELPVFHPNVTVYQAVYRERERDCSP